MHRLFPSVNRDERASFQYPAPYSDEFCELYAERVSDFCRTADTRLGSYAAPTGFHSADRRKSETGTGPGCVSWRPECINPGMMIRAALWYPVPSSRLLSRSFWVILRCPSVGADSLPAPFLFAPAPPPLRSGQLLPTKLNRVQQSRNAMITMRRWCSGSAQISSLAVLSPKPSWWTPILSSKDSIRFDIGVCCGITM